MDAGGWCAPDPRQSQLIRIRIVDHIEQTGASPSIIVECPELQTVATLLEKVVPQLGLEKLDARSLQLQFDGHTLNHRQRLKGAGLKDGSQCSVLGVEAVIIQKHIVKARQVDIVEASQQGRVAEVQLVCQYLPKNVNHTSKVFAPATHSHAAD